MVSNTLAAVPQWNPTQKIWVSQPSPAESSTIVTCDPVEPGDI